MTWIVVAAIAVALFVVVRRYSRRSGRRALLHFRGRVDRFKLTSRKAVRARLLGDPSISAAVHAHAAQANEPDAATWQRVDRYIHEIVPFFNVVAYYQIGYRVAKRVLNLFYKVTVEHEDRAAVAKLPRDSVVIYLMNHRSNADYVLVSYALAGQVALSYAVGEWARAFPLEHIFKAFGSYFVRRKYREPLYHTVLERYVQLITREGVTQGIFLEGGLTRDGLLKTPKIGLLDYVLGIARDPAYRDRMFIVPVAVNYDRVLEDRSLLRELASREGKCTTDATCHRRARCALSLVERRSSRRAPMEALRPRGAHGRVADTARALVRPTGRTVHARQAGTPRPRAAVVRRRDVAHRRARPGDAGSARVRGDSEFRSRLHRARRAARAHGRDARHACSS